MRMLGQEDADLNLVPEAGFDDPGPWRAFAQAHAFRPVSSVAVPQCPDCGANSRGVWGQYIYFSTLLRLRECERCALVWADRRIEPSALQQHFERAYKDAEYFELSRRPIFQHLVEEIAQRTPIGGRVLDIGGATGELMALLRSRRPDIDATVVDVSVEAVATASLRHGLRAIAGDAEVIASLSEEYDTIVLSDVLYYEPNLRALWDAIRVRLKDGGCAVIRLPNKAGVILAIQRLRDWIHGNPRAVQSTVRGFNPEHLYIIRRAYLQARVEALGFRDFIAQPSPPLRSPLSGWIGHAFFLFSRVAWMLSARSLVITPGVVITATLRRRTTGDAS